MVWANGDKYVGGWKECKKHGNGEDTYAEGNRFIGKYEDGLPQGYGEYYWSDGSFYRGTFDKRHKDGQGIMFRKYKQDGKEKWVLYEGGFLADARHGMGEIKWSNGNYYLGEFFNDERNGKGEMRWVDESTYIGEWCKGKRHGWGTLKKPNGVIMTGVFENNEFKGKEYIIKEVEEVESNNQIIIQKQDQQKLIEDERLKLYTGEGSRYHMLCKMHSANFIHFNNDLLNKDSSNKKQQQQKIINKSSSPNERKQKTDINNKIQNQIMNRSSSEMKFGQCQNTDRPISMERRLKSQQRRRNLDNNKLKPVWKSSGGNQASLKIDSNIYMLDKQ